MFICTGTNTISGSPRRDIVSIPVVVQGNLVVLFTKTSSNMEFNY